MIELVPQIILRLTLIDVMNTSDKTIFFQKNQSSLGLAAIFEDIFARTCCITDKIARLQRLYILRPCYISQKNDWFVRVQLKIREKVKIYYRSAYILYRTK